MKPFFHYMTRLSIRPAAAVALVAGCLMSMGSPAYAAYPERPVRLVVPYSPGGTTDLITRIVAQGLSAELGQQVVVENRSGAAGTIGTGAVAKADPDGYTLVMGGTTSLAIAPYMRKHPPYDSRTDLTPVGIVAKGPYLLVVSPNVESTSLKELVERAKEHPGELNYGSSGVGGMHHVLTEKFNRTVGIDALHVPFKGGAENTSNLLAGNIDYMLESVSSILPLVQDGRVKALAVTGKERLAALPDVPTVRESLGSDFAGESIIGIVGPKGLPQNVLDTLNEALEKTMKRPEVKDGIERLGSEPAFVSSEDFAAFLAKEIDSWAKVAQDAGIEKQ